jgi:hypothetical protein
MMRSRIVAAEGGVLLILGVANSITGRLFAAAVLLLLGMLALACAWALWPTNR